MEFHDWLASHVPDMEPGEKQLWQQQTLHLVPGGAGVAAMRDQYRGWAEAAADRRGMRAAGGLRESGESDAGAWVEGSRANVDSRRAGRFARAAGAQVHWSNRVLLAAIGGVLGIAVAYAGTR